MLGVAAADGQVWVEIGDMRVDDSVLYSGVLLLDLPCTGVEPLERVGRFPPKMEEAFRGASFRCWWEL